MTHNCSLITTRIRLRALGKPLLLAPFALLLLACAPSPDAGFNAGPIEQTGKPWLEFSFHEGRSGSAGDVELGTLAADGGGDKVYWLRMTGRNPALLSGPALDSGTTYWTDSRACPVVKGMVASLSQFETDTPMPLPHVDDGTDYTLIAPFASFNGPPMRQTLTGMSGPVAEWVSSSWQSLEPCWSADAPEWAADIPAQ